VDAAFAEADDRDGSAVQEASDADAEPAGADVAASNLACGLCINGTERPRFYVLDRGRHTCTVLQLGWEGRCGGFKLGAGDLCLEAAEVWPDAEACPPASGEASFQAESARGSVVGHEGIVGIAVELSFAAGAPLRNIAVDFSACRRDYEDIKPPCP
jgi:hypothetical protein